MMEILQENLTVKSPKQFFAKNSIIDIWQGPKYDSGLTNLKCVL